MQFRVGVEMALVSYFEKLGVSYWNARDAAFDTATKTHVKVVSECHKKGVSAHDCAAQIERDLASRRRQEE